jgi:ligand-binding sensor domain-containing protein
MKHLLLLLFLTINVLGLYAINTPLTWGFLSKNYSIEDGLPSVETYDVVVDDKEYLYLTADHGLMRFNGHQFDLIPFTSGEIGHAIFEFFKDAAGRIWYSSLDKGIFCLEQNNLHPYKYNDLIIQHTENAIVQDFAVDNKNFVNNIGKIDASGNFCYITTGGENTKLKPS